MRVVGIVLSAVFAMAHTAPAYAQDAEMLEAPVAEERAETSAEFPPSAPVTPPAALAPAEPAPASDLGGAGESCRARSDCASGLRCIVNACRDPLEGTACGASSECGPHLRCFQQTCQSPLTMFTRAEADDAEVGEEGEGEEEEVLTLRGVHGFIGASLMIGPTFRNLGNRMEGALLIGLRAGLVVSGNELALEVTPFSSFYGLEVPVFQLNVSYGYLIPVMRGRNVAVYWPMRAGVGFLVGDTGGAYVEARADVLGIALQVDQVMIDFHLPSFRFAWPPDWPSEFMLHWYAGVSVSYIF